MSGDDLRVGKVYCSVSGVLLEFHGRIDTGEYLFRRNGRHGTGFLFEVPPALVQRLATDAEQAYGRGEMPSTYQLYVARWSGGCGSDQCAGAQRVCLARGQVPCDLLFVGEAPGESEDVLGRPFVGPAGRLLDQIIAQAVGSTHETEPGSGRLRVAFTNLVCCIPRDGDSKATAPEDSQVLACGPRLSEFVGLADPALIVCVGALARDWLDPGYKHRIRLQKEVPRIDIVHPAAVLRANVALRGLMVQRAVVQIQSAVEEHCSERLR